MFTGIIQTIGEVRSKQSQASNILWGVWADFSHELDGGESVAINGACHTVINKGRGSTPEAGTARVEEDDGVFYVESIQETLDKTNIGDLEIGSKVNLERCLTPSSRMNGHIVQGHIDTTAQVIGIDQRDDSWRFHFCLQDSDLMKYIVYKGSIAIDGVSLTISQETKDNFSVDIIPHTFGHTIFCMYTIGSKVNIETDIIARHVEKLRLKG